MKKLFGRILAFASTGIVVLFSTLSYATSAEDSGFYLKLSYGIGNVKELKTTEVEKRLFEEKNIVGSYATDSKSHPYEIGVGYRFSKYLAVRILNNNGLHAEVNSVIGYKGKILGDDVQTDLFQIKRSGKLSGYSLTFEGSVEVYGPLRATMVAGGLYGQACVSASSPKIPYGIEAVSCIEGVVPILGAGLSYKEKYTGLTFTVGKVVYHKYVDIASFGIEYPFR